MPLVAFRLGSEPIYTYTALVDLGLLIAVLGMAREGRRRGWSSAEVLETLAWALVPALAAGRVAYLAGLGLHPWQPQPWGEGFSFAGSLTGGAAGLALLAALRRRPYPALAGAIVPGLAFGQALGWLGAAAQGVVAGAALPPDAWWAPHLRDIYGIVLIRFPLQYLAAALSLLAWAVIIRARLGDAARVAWYALLTGWGLAALASQVEQRRPIVAGLSLDQALYVAFGAAGLAALLWLLGRMAAKARRTRLAARLRGSSSPWASS